MSTYKIQLRGDVSSNWTSVNPILDERELAIETDTLSFKIGNGVLDWNSLPYASVTISAGNNIDVSGGTISLESDIEVTSISATTGNFTTINVDNIALTVPYEFILAASDEVTQITAGTNKVTFLAPNDFILTEATVSLTTTGSTTTTVDVNYNDNSVFATPISLTSGQTYVTSATNTTIISRYGKFTIDFDAAGTGAKGVKVILTGTRDI